jgi:hypothetical protein
VDDKYINYIQLQISAIKDSESGIREVIWGYFDALCTICTKNKPVFRFSKENVCTHCFAEKYGKIALPRDYKAMIVEKTIPLLYLLERKETGS